MIDDRELLREYVKCRSEQAFAELVERHVNMVYATALRLVRETHLAQDVAQSVFIELARKAKRVREGNALSGWLYRTTCCVAANAVRKESRRRRREREAVNRGEVHAEELAASAVAPLLDEAMQQLNDAEQNAVVLRFFEGKRLHEVGLALGITEDAVQKRISRALQKLRTHFSRRGVAVSSAVIFSALATQSAAPAGLAAGLAGASIAGASAAGATGLTTIVETIFMTKAKATIVTAVVVAAAGTAVYEAQQASTLRKEIRLLQVQHAERIRQLQGEHLAAATAPTSPQEKAPMTAAELEAKIQNIARRSNWRLQIEWREFIQTLAARDIPRALAIVENISQRFVREVFRSDLLEHWAQSDPKAALAYAQSVPADFSRNTLVNRVLHVWANYNPSSLRAWVQELPNGRLRRQALDAVIGPSAAENPHTTLALIESIGDLVRRPNQLETLFEMWARTDPAAAIAKAAELQSADLRAGALAKIAGSWAAIDPKAALAWAEALPPNSQRDKLLEIMLRRWDDPKQAAAYILDLPAGRLRDEVLPSVVRHWAGDNPPDVLVWGQSLADSPIRTQATEWALASLAESRPQEALATSQSLSGPERDDAITMVARIWAEGDLEGALEHARFLPEGADRNSYMTGLVQVLANSSPSTAAQLVTSLPPSDARDGAVRNIVNTLSQVDPATTAGWVETLPEGKLRDDAFGELAYKWTRKDPSAVTDWLQSLPRDKSWESAFQGYIARISDRTPEMAASLAETISDPARRNTMIELVTGDWMKKDRKAASTWLEQTTLPNDRKLRLLEGW